MPFPQPGEGAVSSVAAKDTSVVISPTTGAVKINTATLDVIATDQPPAAAVPMNGQKITGLANGTAATDAAAFGQIPTILINATRVIKTSAQSIQNTTTTAIIFDTVEFDGLGAANLTVHNNLLTIPTTGLYLVGMSLEWQGAAAGYGYCEIWKNSFASMIVEGAAGGIPLTDGPELSGFAPVLLTAGDTIQMSCYQSSGGALNANSTAVAPSMWIVRLAASA
jgi:hypothetical protein